MSEASLEYSYLYPFSSRVERNQEQGKLQLATSQIVDTYPYFFEGKLLAPRTTAQLLVNLAKIVSTRFYIPPQMLNRFILERDPVVTSGGGILRFEGFSACCSTYARVDISPEGYSGKVVGNGTTNVDFNSATRAALSSVRDQERLSVSVGPDELMLKHGFKEVVERKVMLPKRWIKGFVEVQAYQSRMEKRLTVDKVESRRFFQSLPRNANNRSEFWVVPVGSGKKQSLRLSQRQTQDGVKISGLKRLNILSALSPFADGLTIYADPAGESSEWRIDCGGISFSLTITANVSRGFSGEGQALSDLANQEISNLAKIRAALKWQSCIETEVLASQCELKGEDIRGELATLGSQGLVGYDVTLGGYFHRELPFSLEQIEEVNPRLRNAKKLIERNCVRISKSESGTVSLEVDGTDVTHKVTIGSQQSCTCPWHSKYQGARGNCKHILAALLLVNEKKEQEIEL